MELTGNLKKQVEQTSTKEEAKKVIEGAGMLLTDEELEQVSGGVTQQLGISPNGSALKAFVAVVPVKA